MPAPAPSPSHVSAHYTHGGLTEAIRDGLTSLGKAPDSVTIDDLAPVDEFHIGGRIASEDFLDQLGLTAETQVLDIGCGLGGAARFVATRYGCRVTGIDLTREYVETGNILSTWVGLDQRISLQQGSALALPFDDSSFDRAYMMHVGMNIEDKETLAVEVARILRPGAVFGIYDVMRTGPGDLAFPLPWASTPDLSAVATPERYKAALLAAGFVVTAERNRRDFALAYFADLRAQAAAVTGPPPLSLHLLLGKTRPEKMANMVDNITNGRIAPVELIVRKTG
jgi:SAM-dependent methyltransferase